MNPIDYLRCTKAKIFSYFAVFLIFFSCGDPLEHDYDVTLEFLVPPADSIVAGESVEIQVGILPESAVEDDDFEIELALSHNQFSNGETTQSASVDGDGIASFQVSIEQADSDYFISASLIDESLVDPIQSAPFDIVAGSADPQNSWIYGEDGIADGEFEAEIIIELFDEFGNPVHDVTPTFLASGDGNSYGPCNYREADQFFRCTMSSTEPGEKILEITDPVEVVGESIQFFPFDCDPDSGHFGGGDGSDNEPYLICSPDHLVHLGGNPEYYGDSFVLASNINMDGVPFNDVIGEWHPFEETTPFVGNFSGLSYTIENLSISISGMENEGTGLFGYIGEGGRIEDIRLTDVFIEAEGVAVGGLAGRNEGEIINCHASVDIEAGGSVGGLVGRNHGEIHRSSSDGTISGDRIAIGGLVGGNHGLITQSYSTAYAISYNPSTTMGNLLGGFAGANEGEIRDSFSTGQVSGTNNSVGGFTGRNWGSISQSYSAGPVTSENASGVGGFNGTDTNSQITQSYWDISTSGVETSAGGEGLNTTDFSDLETYFSEWDFEDIWELGTAPDGEERPILRWMSE